MVLIFVSIIFLSLGLSKTSQAYENVEGYLEEILQDEMGSRLIFKQNYTESDVCVYKCFTNASIPSEVRHFFYSVGGDVFKPQNSTNIRRLFNATMLDWYCGYAKERHTCILNCGDGMIQREILKFLRPTSYICNETDFINHAKCYRTVYEEDVDECESGEKCLTYKMEMVRVGNTGSKLLRNNKTIEEAMQKVFDNLCQYISCGNQCRSSQLIQKCGEESSEVLLEFYRRIVSSLKQVAAELCEWSFGMQPQFQDACDQL